MAMLSLVETMTFLKSKEHIMVSRGHSGVGVAELTPDGRYSLDSYSGSLTVTREVLSEAMVEHLRGRIPEPLAQQPVLEDVLKDPSQVDPHKVPVHTWMFWKNPQYAYTGYHWRFQNPKGMLAVQWIPVVANLHETHRINFVRLSH